ncbi:hypothetical protein Bca52824_066896, partial [Brassica carinata]
CCRTSVAIPSRTTLFTIIHQPDNVTKPRESVVTYKLHQSFSSSSLAFNNFQQELPVNSFP